MILIKGIVAIILLALAIPAVTTATTSERLGKLGKAACWLFAIGCAIAAILLLVQ